MTTLNRCSAAVLALLVAVLAQGVLAQRSPGAERPTDASDPRLLPGPKTVAVGTKSMVATQLPLVTHGAVDVLRNGGNAVDAAITAVFLQFVNDYHQVSVFGAMSGLYYDAATRTYHAFNGFSERPDASRPGPGDASKVAIGGTVRTLESLSKRFGTQSWASYLEPAIASAESGVLVTNFMYGNNYSLIERGELSQDRGAREFYMPDGHLVPVGQLWRMPRLAKTLRDIVQHGADHLYTGKWGREFVAEANRRGGKISIEDMAAYETRWLEPLRFNYRGHQIIVEPAPNSGGLIVGYNLNLLEQFDLKALGHYAESPETMEIMARAFGRVEDEVRWTIEDPLSFQVPGAVWLSPEYGRLGAEVIRQTMRRRGVDLATGSPSPSHGEQPQDWNVSPDVVASLGSNHNVIVDSQGNWISFLHTGHGGMAGVFIDGVRATGSGVYSRDTGPGRRIIAAVTGVIVATDDGEPWLSFGTPGYPPQPLTEVLINLIDFGLEPAVAAEMPRFWAFRGRGDRLIESESRISDVVRQGLKASGIRLRELGDYNWHTGSMQIIWRDAGTGRLHGVSDPRRLGLAFGF